MSAMKIMLLVPHLSGCGGERIVSDLSCNLNADELVLVVFEKKFSLPLQRKRGFTEYAALRQRSMSVVTVLSILASDILPIFAIAAIGYLLEGAFPEA